jgi:hypothetical protein
MAGQLSQQAHVIERVSALSGQSQFVVPFNRDEDFVGREDVIGEIDHILSDPKKARRVALAGLGGVGYVEISGNNFEPV